MRAFQSQVQKSKVFGQAGRAFLKMDISKNVQNRFLKFRFEKILANGFPQLYNFA
jgi:hypothetical protein